MIIFDIGANKGAFSEACLNKYANPTIIAVEPNDALIPKLYSKFRDYPNIIILNYVMSNKSKEIVNFYISDIDTISTASTEWIDGSRFSNKYKWNKIIQKETLNLDTMISRYGQPDLIKIDVEGYELNVIQGLSKKQSDICFEWAEEEYDKLNCIIKYLEFLGYYNFGFTYGDDHLTKPEQYSCWNKCLIHNNIVPKRKEKWGMIWAY